MIRYFAFCVALLGWAIADTVAAQQSFSILDVNAVPYLQDAAAHAAYQTFLVSNLPRAFSVSSSGKIGWAGGSGTLEQERQTALRNCEAKGAADCTIYAENLDVVWRGRAPQAPQVPGPLISTGNYSFVPDSRYLWRGAQAAAGVFVWAHGKGSNITQDERGQQPPSYVRWFNNAGFDVVRFDRYPAADERERAAGWLRDALAELRRRGYRRIIAGGQSRGAWNSLQMLDSPTLADVVIAVSPAAHGSGASVNLLSQTDDFRRVLADAPPQRTRVAFVQFENDFFIGDADTRRRLIEQILRPKIGALLLIDRPGGFAGHTAGGTSSFGTKFGACLLRFATAPDPPSLC